MCKPKMPKPPAPAAPPAPDPQLSVGRAEDDDEEASDKRRKLKGRDSLRIDINSVGSTGGASGLNIPRG